MQSSIFDRFASKHSDTDETRFSKKLILIIAIICCLCGLCWSAMYYIVFGIGLTMLLPLLFVFTVTVAMIVSAVSKNHLILVYTQLTCITWISALIQWSIGPIHDTGLVISWSFLGPIGALLFLNKKESFLWLLMFLAIVFVSVVVEPKITGSVKTISEGYRNLFYVMNLGVPAVVVFAAAYYFVKELVEKKKKNEELLEITEEKNEEILDSIRYAKRIQSAILPSEDVIHQLLKETFVMYKPKDIVAGDFYWIEEINGAILVAVADCTGHGVPGAMVSVICNNGLNKSVHEFGLEKPNEILDKTRELVIKEFEKSAEDVKDGMDIALCSIRDKNISYAGANNPLWIVRENEVIEFKANKQPIGNYEYSQPFSLNEFELADGDCLYMFSDGFVDQFGGDKGKKFKVKPFKNYLISIAHLPMQEQKVKLKETFFTWMGTEEQVDDVCLIGIKINS